MYSEVHQNVKEELHLARYVAITTDMWTSIANEDYMAVTAHFYSGAKYALKMTHRCLEVVPFTEVSHTAVNLKSFLLKVFSDWSISSKVVAIIRDNGADITAALNRSQFEAISCVAHTLQLVIKDGLMNNKKITTLLKKTKKLVGSFKHSAKNSKLLKSCQTQLRLPQHRMIQDEPTRWNSSLHMLRRVIEQKEAIILVSSKSDIKLSVDMVSDDWMTMQYAVSILEIFEQATLQVSKSSSTVSEERDRMIFISFSSGDSTYTYNKNVVENSNCQGSGLQGLKNDLISSLKLRYPNVEANLTYACATILDPGFKATPFQNSDAIEAAKVKIIKEMVALTQTDSTSRNEPAVENATSTLESPGDKSYKGLWSHYKDYFCKSVDKVDCSASSCENELLQYLGEKTLIPKTVKKFPIIGLTVSF
ncbi:zinc finger BED domain-containing protein 4-like [Ischnura elegans]|uniref:zinc finger BED domain-containing protein 4-like n=1 Tax=Ischnura elegans TaxID=197161 RepID=UPI001ED86E91|nr:zinc finger BED domain-containing protein 4-like [Ischnura elegans]